jgi:ABC-type branched-subunit amino acid transport system ATPase component
MNDKPILVLEAVEKSFGTVRVLCGVNATLNAGRITAFVGPNGAGKTTLFHAITGDLKVDRGAVVFEGRSLVGLPPWKIARRGLGKMFQDVRVFESLSVIENVLLALHDHASQSPWASVLSHPFCTKKELERKERAVYWLKTVGLEGQYDKPAGQLSFGNQKLLAFARLLAGGFRLLLLDEPTAGVAPPLVERIGELLHGLVKDHGVSIALIEHNYSFVTAVAHTVYVLQDGVVRDQGVTKDVLSRDGNREILIGI